MTVDIVTRRVESSNTPEQRNHGWSLYDGETPLQTGMSLESCLEAAQALRHLAHNGLSLRWEDRQ